MLRVMVVLVPRPASRVRSACGEGRIDDLGGPGTAPLAHLCTAPAASGQRDFILITNSIAGAPRAASLVGLHCDLARRDH